MNYRTVARVGFFLALRDIRRANLWTTGLIIFVMTLTFLNLVIVGGILVGLIESSSRANRLRYSGDVIVSNLPEKEYISNSPTVMQIAGHLPGVVAITGRYIQGGKLEANYKTRIRQDESLDTANGLITGIDPIAEDRVTGLSQKVIDGQYLAPDDTDAILIGANLLFRYTPIDSPGLKNLKTVTGAGETVRLTVNGNRRDVLIKGVLKSKVGEVDQRIFMTDKQLRPLIGRGDYNVDEIAIKLNAATAPETIKSALLASGIGQWAKVQTWSEAQPKFIQDIKDTFAILGNIVGGIGLIVASITIFIVIFVNAINRRKFIGILKGIGVSATAIEFSYIIQAAFYAFLGTGIGLAILYGIAIPAIAAHPINFPFSDGILVATIGGTMARVGLLLFATLIAGYLPARMIVKQNTLSAILGR